MGTAQTFTTLCEELGTGFTPQITLGTNTASITYSNALPPGTPAPSNWTGKKILINGKFVVVATAPVIMTNCKVKFATSAKIEINPSSKLTVKYSKLFSCTTLWDGIVMKNGAAIVIYESRIEDAKKALTIAKNGNVSVSYSKFYRNSTGIYCAGTAASPTALNLAKFYANEFKAYDTDGLNAPFDSEANSKYGINLKYVTGVIGAPTMGLPAQVNNKFDNLCTGINTVYCDVIVQNCLFTKMRECLNTDESGIGIISNASTGTAPPYESALTVEPSTATNGQLSGFSRFENNLYGGISTTHTNLFVQRAAFKDDGAYNIYSSANTEGQVVWLLDNTFDIANATNTSAIHLARPMTADPLSTHTKINDNRFNISGNASTYAIDINGSGGPSPDIFEANRNIFHFTTGGYANHGFLIYGGDDDNYHLAFNEIYFDENTNNVNGGGTGIALHTAKGESHWFEKNKVVSGGIGSPFGFYGINLNTAKNTALCFNFVDGVHYGFTFSNNCDGTSMNSNSMNYHKDALTIKGSHNPRIGDQIRRGNTWNATSTGNDALHLAPSLWDYSEFKIETASQPLFPDQITPSTTISEWFKVQTGTLHHECEEDSVIIDPTIYLSEYDEAVIADTMAYDGISPRLTQWEDHRDLVYKLLRHPDLAPSGSAAEAWLSSISGTTAYQYATANHLFSTANHGTEQWHTDLQLNRDKQRTLRDSILSSTHLYTVLDDSTSIDTTLLLFTERQLERLTTLDAEATVLTGQIKISRDARIDQAVTYIQTLPADELYESDLQQVYLLLASRLVGHDWTSTDSIMLRLIANHCILDAGQAVIMAQVMLPRDEYRTIVERGEFANCNNNMRRAADPEVEGLYSIAPNPARDILTINLQTAASGTWHLSNTLGTVVQQGDLDTQQQLGINIAELPNGMYFFTLSAEGKRRVTKSVFVVR